MNTQMARPNQDLEKTENLEKTRNQGYPENPEYIQNPGEGVNGSKIIHPDQLGRRAGLGLRGELMLRVDLENEDELITPTIEQLSILDEKVINYFFSCLAKNCFFNSILQPDLKLRILQVRIVKIGLFGTLSVSF